MNYEVYAFTIYIQIPHHLIYAITLLVMTYFFLKLFHFKKNKNVKSYDTIYNVILSGKQFLCGCKAYWDSGNFLNNPYDNSPVIIIHYKQLKNCISEHTYSEIKKYVTTGVFPYETINTFDNLKCFPLPYRTLSSTSAVMPAFHISKLKFVDYNTSFENVTVAISKEPCLDKKEYQVLLHESLKPNREENSND